MAKRKYNVVVPKPEKKRMGRPPIVRTKEEQKAYEKEKHEKEMLRRKTYKPKKDVIQYVDTYKQSENGEMVLIKTASQSKYRNLIIKKPKYTNPVELEILVDEYFDQGAMTQVARRSDAKTDKVKEVPIYTMAGLALYLGFKTRRALVEYEKKDEFRDIIQTAVLRVEAAYEAKLHGNNAAGAIFALKNVQNRWTDHMKTSVDVTVHPFTQLMKAKAKKDNE